LPENRSRKTFHEQLKRNKLEAENMRKDDQSMCVFLKRGRFVLLHAVKALGRERAVDMLSLILNLGQS